MPGGAFAGVHFVHTISLRAGVVVFGWVYFAWFLPYNRFRHQQNQYMKVGAPYGDSTPIFI